MRAFVTGATGFIGSHLVDALLLAGHDVICLARNPAKLARLFGTRPAAVTGDLADGRALRSGCAGVDVVYHIAGLTAARTSRDFFTINHDATTALLAAAREAAPALERFIYLSSLSAAGPSQRGHPVTEQDEPHPISDYGRSKLAGENAVRGGGLPWTIVRPPAVYGARDREFLRLYRLARWGLLPLFGNAEQELSLVQVEELAQALLAVAAPACAYRTYHATHREVLTSRTALSVIFETTQGALPDAGRQVKRRFIPVPDVVTRLALWTMGTSASVLGRTTLLSPDKAPELLAEAWTCSPDLLERDSGWRATLDFAAGSARTAAWYVEHRWL